MDFLQFQRYSLQQMDLVHPQVPYVTTSHNHISKASPDPSIPEYPVLLTAWHLIFATILTQLMARFTTILDGRKKQKMNGRIYIRAIVPIGAAFSLSLICGNLTYLYLSVSFIQMLKVSYNILQNKMCRD